MSSGRFQARYYGPDLQYHSGPTTFDTKGDAQAWLMTERALVSQQRWTPPKVREDEARRAVERRRAQTFALYAERWLEGRVTTRGKGLRPSTVAGYRNALDVHILPAFGALPLDEINSAVVRHWRGQFAARGNDSAGAKAYSVLKAILQTAEDDELILRNPCRLKGGGSAAKVRESVALSPAELAALVDAMPPQWRALTLVSGWCGLRIGEAAGLRVGDVDLGTGALHIRQTAQYIGHPARLVLGPPKSERGIRIVHMPDHVTEALGTFLGTKPGTSPKDFVWTRTDGQPISRHTDPQGVPDRDRLDRACRDGVARPPPHGQHPRRRRRRDPGHPAGSDGSRRPQGQRPLPPHLAGPRPSPRRCLVAYGPTGDGEAAAPIGGARSHLSSLAHERRLCTAVVNRPGTRFPPTSRRDILDPLPRRNRAFERCKVRPPAPRSRGLAGVRFEDGRTPLGNGTARSRGSSRRLARRAPTRASDEGA